MDPRWEKERSVVELVVEFIQAARDFDEADFLQVLEIVFGDGNWLVRDTGNLILSFSGVRATVATNPLLSSLLLCLGGVSESAPPVDEDVEVGDTVFVEADELSVSLEVEDVFDVPTMGRAVWLSPPTAPERYIITHEGSLVLFTDAVGTAADYGPVRSVEPVEE